MLERIRKFLVIKFILGLTLTLFCVLAIITLINVSYQKNVLIKKETESFYRLEETILASLLYSMQKGDQEGIQKQFNDYRGLKGIKAVHLLNHDGIVKRSADPALIDKKFIDEKMLEALQGKEFSGVEIDKDTNLKVFRRLRSIFNEETCHHCHGTQQKVLGVLSFISDWSPVEKILSSTQERNISLSIFTLIVLIGLISFYVFRMILRPVQELTKATQKIAAGDLTYQIEVRTEDEIGRLGLSFNEMVKDINVSQEEIQQQSEEIATANEESQAANEELVATNEQLLQTTEELEKAKIELQNWAATLEEKVDEKTEELRVANDRLVTVTDGIEESIMLLDTNFKIIWANKKTLDFSGFKIGEVIGNYCYKITHNQNEPCKGPQDICPIIEVLEAGKPVTALHTHLDKKGNKFYVEVTAYPIRDTQGKIVQFVHLAHNVTEKMKLQEELKHNISDLEKANANLKAAQAQLIQSAKMASIGQLAAGLAHEINNPLTGVLNNVQLIKMQLEQKGDSSVSVAEFKEILGIVEESALRCTKITRSLLEFSRASTISIQPVSINEVVERVFNLIGHELILQNITIQTDLQPQLPLIQGNLQLLQQVFMNLITNARWAIKKKSLHERGTITIKTQHDTQSNKVNIYITDTGIGMPPEILNRLFEPFFTTKEIGEGTGLGLSVTYGIIKEHQGTIEAESQTGQGTTFKISLPVS